MRPSATQTEEQLLERLSARDASLWPEHNLAPSRLGWLDSPREMERARKGLDRWAATIDQDTVVVLGMGGATAAARVLAEGAESFSAAGARHLYVGDTTEPETLAALPLERAFIVVCSKSGTTRETRALFDYARTRNADLKRYAVISDARTPLARQAEELRVQRVFESRPDLAGCYAALDLAGVVPAALLGYDLEEFLGRALDVDRHLALSLGVELGEAALQGVDRVTIETAPDRMETGRWAAQLLGSGVSGGRGIIGVPSSEAEGGSERQLLGLGELQPHELGALFFRLQLAAAISAHVLGVDPFGPPATEAWAARTAELLAELPLPTPPVLHGEQLDAYLREHLADGDYLRLEAYLPDACGEELEALRRALRDRYGQLAVTASLAPRALHAASRLRHEGPSSGLVVQLVPRAARAELPVPGTDYDFGTLTDALALADAETLASEARRVVRVAIDEPGELC